MGEEEKSDSKAKDQKDANKSVMQRSQLYFGQGYGAKILTEFMDYFRDQIDPIANTFIINPACDNPRAKHVYMKAGFIPKVIQNLENRPLACKENY